MSNYVLDHAYRVEEEDGIAAHRAVVMGSAPDACAYPAAANAQKVLGITTHAQLREGKNIAVRRLGIAPCEVAGAIAAGDPVRVADSTGKIAKAARATADFGSIVTNDAVRFTFNEAGALGDLFTVELTQAAGASAALAGTVSGPVIAITLGTNGASAANTTAAALVTFINAHASISKLVTASHIGASNGTGVVEEDTVAMSGGLDGMAIIGFAQQTAAEAGDIIDVLLRS